MGMEFGMTKSKPIMEATRWIRSMGLVFIHGEINVYIKDASKKIFVKDMAKYIESGDL